MYQRPASVGALDTIEPPSSAHRRTRGRSLRVDQLRGLRPRRRRRDRRNPDRQSHRTSAEIKHVFAQTAAPSPAGAVSWQFDRNGQHRSEGRSTRTNSSSGSWTPGRELRSQRRELHGHHRTAGLGSVRDAPRRLRRQVLSAELTLVPQNSIPVDSNPSEEDSSPDGRH